jgi:hypothetical protein
MDLRVLNTGVAWSRRPRIFGAWDGAVVLLAESVKTDSNKPIKGKGALARRPNLCSRGW